MKKTRKLVTFEPEDDLLPMLARAKEHGLTFSDVMNNSLRECGSKVIADLARGQMGKLKKLLRESFKFADGQPVSLIE